MAAPASASNKVLGIVGRLGLILFYRENPFDFWTSMGLPPESLYIFVPVDCSTPPPDIRWPDGHPLVSEWVTSETQDSWPFTFPLHLFLLF